MRVRYGSALLAAFALTNCGADSPAQPKFSGSKDAGPVPANVPSGDDSGAHGSSPEAGRSQDTDAGPTYVVKVGNCANLPAKATWENISPPKSNYSSTYTGINAVVIRPDTPGTVIVGADSNGLFRSDDCGATWTAGPINTGRNKSALSSGRPWSMVLDPIAPDVMYVVEGYGTSGLWKTVNAGVDWDQVLTTNVSSLFSAKGQITSVSMDPADHTHLVVESHGAGTGECQSVTCLAESNDSGTTWSLLKIPTAWSENSGVAMLSRKVWLYGALFGGLWRTADEGVTWKQVSSAYASVNYYQPHVWQDSAGIYYVPTDQQGLLQSKPNDTSSWTLIASGPAATTLFPGAQNLFMSNEFNTHYYTASQSAPGTWKAFPSPPQKAANSQGGGGVFMNYDAAHHVLYSSNFDAGLWRIVTD